MATRRGWSRGCTTPTRRVWGSAPTTPRGCLCTMMIKRVLVGCCVSALLVSTAFAQGERGASETEVIAAGVRTSCDTDVKVILDGASFRAGHGKLGGLPGFTLDQGLVDARL